MNLIGKLQPVIILAAAFCAWFWVRSRPLARSSGLLKLFGEKRICKNESNGKGKHEEKKSSACNLVHAGRSAVGCAVGFFSVLAPVFAAQENDHNGRSRGL